MHQQYHVTTGRHSAARALLAALLLALTIASAGQTSPAQAAPDNPANVSFEVVAFPEAPPPLCINENLQIYVGVNKVIVKTINDKEWTLPRGTVTGVDVRGSVTNSNIGILTPPDTSPVQLVDFRQGSADFLFTAKKVGTTTLIFSADVPGAWTGSAEALALGKTYPARQAEIQVKVRNCKFKVGAASRWHLPGPHEFDIEATIDNAEMKADEQGHLTGSATVNWAVATTVLSPICNSANFTVSPSQADLTGQMDDSGLLVVNLPYQAAAASVTQVCRTPTGTQTSSYHYQLAPDPLHLSVDSAGGAFNPSQVLVVTATDYGGTAPLAGSSVIVVIPEDCSGTASC